MKRLIHEIHHRSLWQVLGIYLMGSWVVLQVVGELVQSAGLPDWVPSLALVLLLIGLPMVMATAFVQEGMPGRDHEAPPDPAATPAGAARNRAPKTPLTTPASTPGWLRGNVFTWRNAIGGGVAALALFGAATAAWMVMRTAGVGTTGTLVARGLINNGERIVLADFSGDSALAAAATMSLRVQLAESGVVSVAEPSLVASVLARMEAEPGHVTQERAREVAEREGFKAVVSGGVASAGGGLIVNARVIETASGEELVNVAETVSDPAEFLGAVDRLGRKLRERLGESLGSIRGTVPLERATTSSIEALRKYTRAEEAFAQRDLDRAIALLDEAIALDSGFAMAWRKLAVADPERRDMAATRAYELRDRLTERERYHTIGIYQTFVLADGDAAITTYRGLVEAYPDDATGLNNLAVAYVGQGQFDLGVEKYARAIDVDPYDPHYYPNLIWTLYAVGNPDSARAVLDSFSIAFPDHANVSWVGAEIAYEGGDAEAAEAALDPLLASDVPSLRRQANRFVANLRVREGKIAEGRQAWRQSVDDPNPFDEARWEGWQDLRVRRDTTRALARMQSAIEAAPDSAVDEDAGGLANFFYEAGDVTRGDRYYARELVVDSVRLANRPERLRRLNELGYQFDRNVAKRDYEAALSTYREGDALARRVFRGLDPANWADDAIPVFEALGQADSVIARYEIWMGRREMRFRLPQDARHLPAALERLGQLYDAKGDAEKAALYYAQFVELWENADPELQPRVRAARARLNEIVQARG